MADTTQIDLAAEAERKAQEALKLQRAREKALMDAYTASSQGIYDISKEKAGGLLAGSKSDIEALYGRGYEDLQKLIGEESEAAIKQSLRPIESKLTAQGLLGGPSGALNEALAGAAERTRATGIGRLAEYQGKRTGALANMYGLTAQQLASLEQAYGTQSQALQATALENALAGTARGTELAEKFGLTGLEAALGTGKMVIEQAGQKDILAEQARLNAEAIAAATATRQAELKTKQDTWDRQYQDIKASLYRSYMASGMGDKIATEYANREALKQVGPRPV